MYINKTATTIGGGGGGVVFQSFSEENIDYL